MTIRLLVPALVAVIVSLSGSHVMHEPAWRLASAIPCEEDACQPLPPPPEDPTPGTLVPSEGNPPVYFPKQHNKRHQRHRHGHKSPRP